MNLLESLRKLAAASSSGEKVKASENAGVEGVPLKVLRFFHDNPNPTDDKFHRWAEKQGMEPDDAEEIAYRFVTEFSNFVFGGKSKGKIPGNLNEGQLLKGIEVELEHTPNRAVCAKIALDHLTEFSNYYDALAKMEASLKG